MASVKAVLNSDEYKKAGKEKRKRLLTAAYHSENVKRRAKVKKQQRAKDELDKAKAEYKEVYCKHYNGPKREFELSTKEFMLATEECRKAHEELLAASNDDQRKAALAKISVAWAKRKGKFSVKDQAAEDAHKAAEAKMKAAEVKMKAAEDRLNVADKRLKAAAARCVQLGLKVEAIWGFGV